MSFLFDKRYYTCIQNEQKYPTKFVCFEFGSFFESDEFAIQEQKEYSPKRILLLSRQKFIPRVFDRYLNQQDIAYFLSTQVKVEIMDLIKN